MDDRSSLLPFLVALLLSACGGIAETPQVIVLAVDGLDPLVLTDLLHRGQLPEIQALVNRGSLARIRCPAGMKAPAVWTTVATGRPPGVHGISDFEIAGRLPRSWDRRQPAYWNLFSAAGLRTAQVGWWATWPAETDSGMVVSDRAHIERAADAVYPLDLHASLPNAAALSTPPLEEFTALSAAAQRTTPESPPEQGAAWLLDHLLRKPLRRDTFYVERAVDLLIAHDPDLLALGLQGIDAVGHGFWRFRSRADSRSHGSKFTRRESEQLATVIPAYYRYLDRIVGEIRRAARADALILLLSDHGFQGAPRAGLIGRARHSSASHREPGVLIVSGEGVERGVTQTRQISHYDVLPTLLWITGQAQSSELPGRPLTEYLSRNFSASAEIPRVESYAWSQADRPSSPPTMLEERLLDEQRWLGHLVNSPAPPE